MDVIYETKKQNTKGNRRPPTKDNADTKLRQSKVSRDRKSLMLGFQELEEVTNYDCF